MHQKFFLFVVPSGAAPLPKSTFFPQSRLGVPLCACCTKDWTPRSHRIPLSPFNLLFDARVHLFFFSPHFSLLMFLRPFPWWFEFAVLFDLPCYPGLLEYCGSTASSFRIFSVPSIILRHINSVNLWPFEVIWNPLIPSTVLSPPHALFTIAFETPVFTAFHDFLRTLLVFRDDEELKTMRP